MNTKEKFEELTQSFAEIDKNFKEIQAKSKIAEAPSPTTQDCMDAMYAMINHVHSRISALADDMYGYQSKHQDGHLPKIVGAGAMNKALAALGMDSDYAAQKKTVYASKDLFTINSN